MTILPVYATSNKFSHVVYIDNSNIGYAFNRHAPFRWAVSKTQFTRVSK